MNKYICIALLFHTANSFACRCNEISAADNFKNADFVIIATVIEVDVSHNYPNDNKNDTVKHGSKAKFAVSKIFKGAFKSDTIIIDSGFSDCSVTFYEKRTYLVYGRETQGAYDTGLCDRTRPLEGNKDIEILNKLK